MATATSTSPARYANGIVGRCSVPASVNDGGAWTDGIRPRFYRGRDSGLNLRLRSAARFLGRLVQRLQQDLRRDVGAVGIRLLLDLRLRQQLVDGRLPLAGEQIVVADERVAHVLRHFGHEDVILGEVAA